MSSPGKARALRALGAHKTMNNHRLANGQKPIIGGKEVSHSTFRRVTGQSAGKTAAKARLAKGK